jgi:PAS domain S-box-containing protein
MDEIADELVSAQGYGTHRYYSSLDHRSHVVGYTRLEAHPWTVVVDLPEGQFLAPMQRLRLVAWVSVGLVGVITLIISILLVRGITRPIHRLTDTATAVEQGQPFEPSGIEDVTSGRDEIAQLGRVFSGMVLALSQELTERKHAEEALQESEEKLNYVSPQIEDILGYTPEEAMKKWTEFASENPINDIGYKHTVNAIETGKPQPTYELEFVHKNGKKAWVEVHEAPIVKNGKTISIVGSFTDITERKQAEDELAKHHHLEDMVQKRTAELQKTINLMAGREVRMAGLKEVIRKLREQVESAGMTPVADDPLKEKGKGK